MNDYAHELQVALEAVSRAARVCQSVQRSLADAALTKDDRSPVTVADFASQAAVCQALQSAFPADPVMGEEGAAVLREPQHARLFERVQRELAAVGLDGGAEQVLGWIDRGAARERSRRFWTLDPIDGTKGFLRGENYAVALALIEDDRLVVSAVAAPNLPAGEGATSLGTLFHAVSGRGAHSRPLAGGDTRQLRVSDREPPGARVCGSVEAAHSDQGAAAAVCSSLGIEREPVRMDSLAKYGLVARGEADLYLRLPVDERRENLWDHTAGILLVLEAGGVVTDVEGRALDLSQGKTFAKNRGVIASNGRFHAQTLQAYAGLKSDMA